MTLPLLLTSARKLLGLPQTKGEECLRKRSFCHLQIKTLVEGRSQTFADCGRLLRLAHFHLVRQ